MADPFPRWLWLNRYRPYRRDKLDRLIALQVGPVRHTSPASARRRWTAGSRARAPGDGRPRSCSPTTG